MPAVVHRWLPALAAVVAIVVFVTAGNWQRGRLAQKNALAEQFAAASAAAAVPLPRDATDWSAWRFRTVDASGRFDANRQFLVDNRVHAGRVGYHVVAPFTLDDGRVVLVNRGFVARGATRDDLPRVPPPDGGVRIRARVNTPPPQYLELGAAGPERGVWQNWGPSRFTAHTGISVMPVVLEELGGDAGGLVRAWALPDVDGNKHLVYMLQWYAFAAMAAGAWIWFTFRGRRTRNANPADAR